jgi:[ribosomal protein S18]-alanine N-acetyltransferase
MDETRSIDELGPTGPGDWFPPGWTVKTLEESDLDGVLEVETASFNNPWTRDMFLKELQNASVSYGYVLRSPERRVVAFCTIWIVVDEIHINNIAVHPDHRGRGLGRALLVSILRQWSEQGASRATLEVRRSNEIAINLYRTLGFRVAGTRKNYYSEPVEDALILWRDQAASPAPAAGR